MLWARGVTMCSLGGVHCRRLSVDQNATPAFLLQPPDITRKILIESVCPANTRIVSLLQIYEKRGPTPANTGGADSYGVSFMTDRLWLFRSESSLSLPRLFFQYYITSPATLNRLQTLQGIRSRQIPI